jgi:hypothetical protein
MGGESGKRGAVKRIDPNFAAERGELPPLAETDYL